MLLQGNNSDGGGGITLLVIVLAAIAIVVFVPRMLRKRRQAQEEPVERGRASPSSKTTMEGLAVDLSELGRELKAHLDTKIKTLDILIQEADKRIKTLRALTGGETAEEEAPAQTAFPQPPAAEPPPVGHLQVYRLADSGLGTVEIARQTGIPPGEVKLILELRKKKQKADR